MKNKKVCILVSRYHAEITESMLAESRRTLIANGFPERHISVYNVPGAYELSIAALKAARTKRWHAVICIGCLIQGETPHFDYISQAVAQGLTQVALMTEVPVIFGVLTALNIEQARVRAGLVEQRATDGKMKPAVNKGKEIAQAACDLLQEMNRITNDHDPSA